MKKFLIALVGVAALATTGCGNSAFPQAKQADYQERMAKALERIADVLEKQSGKK